MRARPRLAVEARDGRLAVVDRDRPGAGDLELTLPGGAAVLLPRHLCGWAAGAGETAGALWATEDDAVAALGGRLSDGRPWTEVLEEWAAGPGRPPA